VPNTVQRLAEGGNVGGDVLATVCRVENVSLSWLLEGKGAPYLVNRTTCDSEAAGILEDLVGGGTGWSVYQLRDTAGKEAVVLTQPASFERKGEWVEYTEVEVIAGEVGERARDVINASNANLERHWLDVDEITLRRLAAGQLGTWQLIGDVDHPGLLLGAESQTSVAEFPREFGEPLSDRGREVGRWFDGLPESRQDAFVKLFQVDGEDTES